MTRWKPWGLLLGLWLCGCAASDSVLREAEALDASGVEVEREAADSCLVLLCELPPPIEF